MNTEALALNPQVKAGDLLYAVGPGHHAPHDSTDLQVYSVEVRAVRPNSSCDAPAAFTIELGPDRPLLGFPKWVYQSFELGITIHRSKSEALHAFASHARRRRDQAERKRDHADSEVQWATNEMKGTP